MSAKPWRERSNQIQQLLLSHITPYTPVKACRLSRRIFQVLKYAGIVTKMFKSHSVSAVSTLIVKPLGLFVNHILRKNQWSKESKLQKFYNKEIFAITFQSILSLWAENEESQLWRQALYGWESLVLNWRKFYEIKLKISTRRKAPASYLRFYK